MRYRQQSPTGDYQFGTATPFFVNSPEGVAQAIKTRLKLLIREWFVDQRIGLDTDLILGYGTTPTRDREIQRCILGTTGVLSLSQYASNVSNRDFTVTATVQTQYGETTITGTF